MTNYAKLFEKVNHDNPCDMVIIEGVVGVGKSSLLEHLVKLDFIPFREPVVDNPILDKFYYDRARYSFPLQVFFLNKRFAHIKEAVHVTKAVMDRSIYGDAIFASMLNANQEMEDIEFEIYQELYQNMLEHVAPPKLMVYLQISVDEAISRIHKRNRDYEQIVERAYWERLNEEYEVYFSQYNISEVLVINVDHLDFEANEDDREYVLLRILERLQEIDTK